MIGAIWIFTLTIIVVVVYFGYKKQRNSVCSSMKKMEDDKYADTDMVIVKYMGQNFVMRYGEYKYKWKTMGMEEKIKMCRRVRESVRKNEVKKENIMPDNTNLPTFHELD